MKGVERERCRKQKLSGDTGEMQGTVVGENKESRFSLA